MKKEISAADFLPQKKTLNSLKKAAKICRGCHLYKNATQTVFGEGGKSARLMVVGEIPGNKEDLTGLPFQGPAGSLLRTTLKDSGLDPEDVYFTNVVKHFKFEYIKNRRMHRSPIRTEIKACEPWLKSEIDVIHPEVILCLGAIAAKTIVAPTFKLLQDRGKWIKQQDLKILVTFHPSAILRAPDREARHQMKALFQRDIKKVVLTIR